MSQSKMHPHNVLKWTHTGLFKATGVDPQRDWNNVIGVNPQRNWNNVVGVNPQRHWNKVIPGKIVLVCILGFSIGDMIPEGV
jgi:hypothetical protein